MLALRAVYNFNDGEVCVVILIQERYFNELIKM